MNKIKTSMLGHYRKEDLDVPHIRRLLLAALMVLFPATFSAAPAATQGNLDGFDAFMAKALENFKVPAVVVVKDGKVLLVKGYADRDTGKKLRITGKTLLPIASITKSFYHDGAWYAGRPRRLEWGQAGPRILARIPHG